MKTVVAFFTERNFAEEAYRELESHDFSPETISVIQKKRDDIVLKFGGSASHMINAAGTSTAVGLLIGGVLGAVVWNNYLPIPGFGSILFGRVFLEVLPLSAVWNFILSSAVTFGIIAGVFGALIGLSIPSEKSHIMEEVLREEGVLLALAVSDNARIAEAKSILERHNAGQLRTLTMTDSDHQRIEHEVPHNGHKIFPEKVNVLDIHN